MKAVLDEKGYLTEEYDATTVKWTEAWRMPIRNDAVELTLLRNEKAEMNGVKGRKIIGFNGLALFCR